MCLVDDRDSEWNLANDIKVANESIVRRNQNIKLDEFSCVRTIFVVPFILAHDIAPYALPIMINAADQVGPAFKLASPVLHRRKGDDDKERTANFLHTENMLDVTDNLNGFSCGEKGKKSEEIDC